jgi:hypothetical protein
VTDFDATPRLLTLSFVEDDSSTRPVQDEAERWAYWHERALREIRYRMAHPEELPPEVPLSVMIPAHDAGDVCGVCGELVSWVDHLPPEKAGAPVRCFAKVRELCPLKTGERLIDGEVVFSSEFR